jgi:hypothetical protein
LLLLPFRSLSQLTASLPFPTPTHCLSSISYPNSLLLFPFHFLSQLFSSRLLIFPSQR